MKKEDIRIKIFANRVKVIAKDNFIKVGDLEKQLGVASGYFSRIASGESKTMSLALALKVGDRFGMTINEIIKYKTREEEITERLNDTFLKELLNEFSKEDLINYIQKEGK